MKGKILTISFIIGLSCSTNKESISISTIDRNENLHEIHVDNVMKEDYIKMSEYFKKVKIIFLETNDDNLIGTINTINVLDNYIITMDKKHAKALYVFDKNGNFLHKIGQKGEGPGEYVEITDSSVDFDKEEVYLYDSYNGRVNKYNIQSGEFIDYILINNNLSTSNHIQYVDNKIYTSAISFDDNSSYLLKEIDASTGQQIASYLKASEYNKGWNDFFSRTEGFFYPNQDRSSKYVQMFMDTVVSINKEGITPHLVLKSKNWISENKIQELIINTRNNNGIITDDILSDVSYTIHRYVEFGNIIYFQYYNKRDIECVIYNTETKTARVTGFLKDDLLYKGERALLPFFAFADEKGIYSYIDSWSIARFLDIAQSEGLNINQDDWERLIHLSEDSNPILLYHEF